MQVGEGSIAGLDYHAGSYMRHAVSPPKEPGPPIVEKRRLEKDRKPVATAAVGYLYMTTKLPMSP